MPPSQVEAVLLPRLLLAACAAELGIYRLLVPALRPRGGEVPLWHSGLHYLGLFLFYFASALAVGVVGVLLRDVLRNKDHYPTVLKWFLSPIVAVFLAASAVSILFVPSKSLSFVLELAFVLAVATVAVSQLFRRGDLGVRFGIFVLSLPLLIHFYATFSVHVLVGEEALWNGLTSEVEQNGRRFVLIAALTMPYCFGARPFVARAAKPGPLLMSVAVAGTGALILYKNPMRGIELAQNGVGFTIGVTAPQSLVALCLMALCAVTWTLGNTLTAPSEHRRRVGVGLGLVVVGGYTFAWPLQYLVGIAGLLLLSRSSPRLPAEEQARFPHRPARPIGDERWQSFMDDVLARLRAGDVEGTASSMVTIRGADGQARSHFVCTRGGWPVTVTVERVDGVVIGVDVRVGEEEIQGPPDWTLRPRDTFHPRPPACRGEEIESPRSFCEEFHVCDSVGLSASLLNESGCKNISDLESGWIAIWTAGVLRYQVYPGRGAPLSSPIPLEDLAEEGEYSTDAFLQMIDSLVSLCGSAREHVRTAETRKEADVPL